MKSPGSNGENLIFSTKLVSDFILPEKIDLYKKGKIALTLRDDGKYPDNTAGDEIYAALLKQDVKDLIATILDAEDKLLNKKFFFRFHRTYWQND